MAPRKKSLSEGTRTRPGNETGVKESRGATTGTTRAHTVSKRQRQPAAATPRLTATDQSRAFSRKAYRPNWKQTGGRGTEVRIAPAAGDDVWGNSSKGTPSFGRPTAQAGRRCAESTVWFDSFYTRTFERQPCARPIDALFGASRFTSSCV
jgi:hypothetical protein